MKNWIYNFLTYLALALIFFNALLLLQLVMGWYPTFASAEQWILILGNFLLLATALFTINRKKPKHFSSSELSLFQLLFFIILSTHAVLLLILLIAKPILFIIYAPFEFFLIAFYIGYYFLLTRHVFPIKR